jgi:transcriptional regulator with XRE-family HTH domain
MASREKLNAQHIVDLRAKAGFKTLTEVADVTGVSISMLSMIESGERIPSPESAPKLMKAYNCSYDDIFLPYDFT